jgi:hypothetical protein
MPPLRQPYAHQPQVFARRKKRAGPQPHYPRFITLERGEFGIERDEDLK